jgi:hypothetical protein
MSFYTFAAKPRLYSAGYEESRTQRRRGERMSLLPWSRPIDRVWLRAGFEKRESVKSSEEGRERICVEFFILKITPSRMGRGVDIRAG